MEVLRGGNQGEERQDDHGVHPPVHPPGHALFGQPVGQQKRHHQRRDEQADHDRFRRDRRAEADRPHDRAAHEQIADAGEDRDRKSGQDVAVARRTTPCGSDRQSRARTGTPSWCIRRTRRNPRRPAHEPRPRPDARQSSDAGRPRPAESAGPGGRGGRRKTCWARPESGGRASPPAPRRRRWTRRAAARGREWTYRRERQDGHRRLVAIRLSGRRSSPGPPRTGRRRCRSRRSRKSARRDPC